MDLTRLLAGKWIIGWTMWGAFGMACATGRADPTETPAAAGQPPTCRILSDPADRTLAVFELREGDWVLIAIA